MPDQHPAIEAQPLPSSVRLLELKINLIERPLHFFPDDCKEVDQR
jgi:hypothetical protein